MTMKRSEKATARREMTAGVEFQHPRLRAEAKAERGHARMTPSEYARERMGRRSTSQEVAREGWLTARRFRKTTRRG